MKHTDVNRGSGLFRSGELETAGKSCATQYLILQCLVATWILSAIVRQPCSPSRRAQKPAPGHQGTQRQSWGGTSATGPTETGQAGPWGLIRALLQSHTNTEVIFGYKAQPADLLVDLLETSENRSLKSKYFGVIVDCPEQFANNSAVIKDRQLWLKTIHNCYQEQTDCILNEIYLPYVLTYKINSKLRRVWHTKICVPKGKERNSTQENKKIFPKHVIKKKKGNVFKTNCHNSVSQW